MQADLNQTKRMLQNTLAVQINDNPPWYHEIRL
jgi:hypothetical protein